MRRKTEYRQNTIHDIYQRDMSVIGNPTLKFN